MLYTRSQIHCAKKRYFWLNARNNFAFTQHYFLECQSYSCLQGLRDFDTLENNSLTILEPAYMI